MNLKTLLANDLKPKNLRLVPVVVEDIGDLETPVSPFLKSRRAGAKCLLESVEQNEKVGRYSFIGLSPRIMVQVDQKSITFTENQSSKTAVVSSNGDPLGILRKIINSIHLQTHPELPTLLGGLVGFISYDFVRFFEKIPDTNGKLDFPY